jgi:hypothetical protein
MHLTVLGHQQFEAHHLGLELTDLMAQGGHLVRRVDGGGVTGWGMTRVARHPSVNSPQSYPAVSGCQVRSIKPIAHHCHNYYPSVAQ